MADTELIRGRLLFVGLCLVAVASPWLLASHPTVAAVLGGSVFLAWLVLFVRRSTGRVAVMGLVLAIGIPLIPGLQEQRQPQLIAFSVVFAVLLVSVLSQARRRGIKNRLALWSLAVPVVLSLFTVVLAEPDTFRFLVGVSSGLVLATAIACGKTATEEELRTVTNAATVIAGVASVIAVAEYLNGEPIYVFTTFQTPGHSTVFRASSVFGHPLVLSCFMISVAMMNLARPIVGLRGLYRSRLLTVALPLAGAAASVSRSAFVLLAAGLVAVLLIRNDGQLRLRHRWTVFLLSAAAVASGIFAAYGDSAFGDRFGELSASSESVRLSGPAVVAAITNGWAVLVGGGPRSVAAALDTGQYDIILGTTDNQFLDAYADYGIIGALLVVVASAILLRGVRARGIGGWARAAVVGAIPVLAAFFFLDSLAWYSLAMVFGLGAGAASTASPGKKTGSPNSRPLAGLAPAPRYSRVRG